jgi:hypothetical protein
MQDLNGGWIGHSHQSLGKLLESLWNTRVTLHSLDWGGSSKGQHFRDDESEDMPMGANIPLELNLLSCAECVWLWMGFGLVNGFIDHYINDLELQAITAPLLISTIHKSPQHLLSLYQLAVSSPAIPWQRLLTVEILQLHALRSCLHSFQCRTPLSCICPGYNFVEWTT